MASRSVFGCFAGLSIPKSIPHLVSQVYSCLKKRVRGVRPIERELEGRQDPQAEAVRGYCLAVRSTITDDGRPPLSASGIKLHDRLEAIHTSIERVGKRGSFRES